ncbi:MAG: hypothetical protein JXR19_07575 [Bacteroidia bacterium]
MRYLLSLLLFIQCFDNDALSNIHKTTSKLHDFPTEEVQNSDSTFKHGLSLSLFGTGFPLGVSYSRFISKRDMLEVGVGLGYIVLLYPPSFGVAYKHYIKDPELFTPALHLGVSGTDILSPLDTPGPFITTPIGVSFFTKKVFADLHFGPTILPNESWIIAVYGGLNIGLKL